MGLLPCVEGSQILKRLVTHQEEGTQQLEPLFWELACQFLQLLSIYVILASKAGHRKGKQCRDEEELKGSNSAPSQAVLTYEASTLTVWRCLCAL